MYFLKPMPLTEMIERFKWSRSKSKAPLNAVYSSTSEGPSTRSTPREKNTSDVIEFKRYPNLSRASSISVEQVSALVDSNFEVLVSRIIVPLVKCANI